MRRRLWLAVAAAGGAALLAPRNARAGGGSAEAEELFQQGRAALEAKDYATACPRFAASLAIERAVGTLISLAQCEEATEHLAAARQHWEEAADFADATKDRLNRGAFARRKMEDLDPRVPRLLVHLAAGGPADTSLVRDGMPLGAGAFEVALPVDPGKHVLVATAPGHEAKRFSLTLGEGEKVTFEVEPGPLSVPEPAPAATVEPPPAEGGWKRGAGYVSGGLAVVGMGLGTYFGVQALSEWSTAKTDCGPGCKDGSPARTERSDALGDATLSDVGLAVGALAAVCAVWFFATAPGTSAVARVELRPSRVPGGGGLVAAGNF
jgi:hypothetical protein